MTTIIELPTTYNGIDMIVTAEVTLDYDGIGSYEYHGQKCYDKGNFVMQEFVIMAAFTDVCHWEVSEPISEEIVEQMQDDANLANEIEVQALESLGD